jgi:membrane fusion protein (multidrug efflux system)
MNAPSKPAKPAKATPAEALPDEAKTPVGDKTAPGETAPGGEELEAAREAARKEALEAELEAEGRTRRTRRGRRRILMATLPLALAVAGGWFWLHGGRFVATDNAYIHQPIVPISADVSGRIAEVAVGENADVGAGDELFAIDPAPYKIALDQAQAALANARLGVAKMRSAYALAKAKLAAAQNVLDLSQRQFDRQNQLSERGVTSASAIDNAKLALENAKNNAELAKLGLAEAAAALGGNPEVATDEVPAVRAAIASRDAAQRNLDKTVIHAPAAGTVSATGNLHVGQFVSPGSPVASLVETSNSWVDANFKETQLEHLRIGQPVTLSVDAYPGLTLTGKITSIGAATGAEFSLIPAQNATGNWVKVVQRIPVRIAFSPDASHPLRDGMSVYASVDTGTNRITRLGWLN